MPGNKGPGTPVSFLRRAECPGMGITTKVGAGGVRGGARGRLVGLGFGFC